jgi:site-specific DNA recombinase
MNKHVTPTPGTSISNTRGKQSAPRLRCAIYTRKSTEEGLDQDFNSLDAQREACAAYITSQASQGWKMIPTFYDDGGISGGTMERPALKQLLNDIKQGQIDIVVVYKIDRLTRSLMDFAKMVDVFDEYAISFVSVTQQFNTTTSMGRLTLNVLLSFAQFEREVTAERIRDKIAASKKKGMWMGGSVPLGYKAEDKKLIINNEEAKTVKWLYQRYLELGSVGKLVQAAQDAGLSGRTYRQKNGIIKSSRPFARGNLYHLLSNPVYIGKTRHQDQIYDGLHEAIIKDDLWQSVQQMLAGNSKARRGSRTNEKSNHLLQGLVFDETGDRLTTTHAIKNGIRYHYYISGRLTEYGKSKKDGWRIPARQLEQPVVETIRRLLSDPLKLGEIIGLEHHTIHEQEVVFETAKEVAEKLGSKETIQNQSILKTVIEKISLEPKRLKIEINIPNLAGLLAGNKEDETPEEDAHKSSVFENPNASDQNEIRRENQNIHIIEIEHKIARRGVEAKLILENTNTQTRNPDQTLIDIIAKAHLWLSRLTDGSAESIHDLSKQVGHDSSEISRFLPLAFLAPDIIESILAGTQPIDLTQEKLRRLSNLPCQWTDQRELFGFAS